MRSDTGAIATSVRFVAEARDASLKIWWAGDQGKGEKWTMSLDAPDRESTAGGGLQSCTTTELTVVALFLQTAPGTRGLAERSIWGTYLLTLATPKHQALPESERDRPPSSLKGPVQLEIESA